MLREEEKLLWNGRKKAKRMQRSPHTSAGCAESKPCRSSTNHGQQGQEQEPQGKNQETEVSEQVLGEPTGTGSEITSLSLQWLSNRMHYTHYLLYHYPRWDKVMTPGTSDCH